MGGAGPDVDLAEAATRDLYGKWTGAVKDWERIRLEEKEKAK